MTSNCHHQEVIEAAKKRVSAAKAQSTSASKVMDAADEMVNTANATMETAIQMLQMAKKSMATAKQNKAAALMQFDVSRREMKEAERLLKEAEERSRWEEEEGEGMNDDLNVSECSDEVEEERCCSCGKKRKASNSNDNTVPGRSNTNVDGRAIHSSDLAMQSAATSSSTANFVATPTMNFSSSSPSPIAQRAAARRRTSASSTIGAPSSRSRASTNVVGHSTIQGRNVNGNSNGIACDSVVSSSTVISLSSSNSHAATATAATMNLSPVSSFTLDATHRNINESDTRAANQLVHSNSSCRGSSRTAQ